jgi:MFS family permease
LVCDTDVYFKTLSQSIFFVGHFAGTLIAGFMGDRLGRKRAFILTLFQTAGFGFASYFVDHPYGWMAIRFSVGVTSMAATTLKTVYTVRMNVKEI